MFIPLSFIHQVATKFLFLAPQLTLFVSPPQSSLSLLPSMSAHGSNKGKKNCNKSDGRTAHTALLSQAHSCTHKAVIKKTTQPVRKKPTATTTTTKKNKAERLFNSPPLPPPSPVVSFIPRPKVFPDGQTFQRAAQPHHTAN